MADYLVTFKLDADILVCEASDKDDAIKIARKKLQDEVSQNSKSKFDVYIWDETNVDEL